MQLRRAAQVWHLLWQEIDMAACIVFALREFLRENVMLEGIFSSLQLSTTNALLTITITETDALTCEVSKSSYAILISTRYAT